jgi:hypothetical protein
VLNALTIAANKAIADMGATSIFIMEGVGVVNKHPATKPLVINLPDGHLVTSLHIYNINILGLPKILTGHIVPDLAIAPLIKIHPLCKVGCCIIFDNEKCNVKYNWQVVLLGFKHPYTDLWTLPITPEGMRATQSQSAPSSDHAPHPNNSLHKGVDLELFTHFVRTQANGVNFAHQALCNPPILMLLKAMRKGYLKGCPNISDKLILKYLNPSPTTAKGHMKHPCHGIRSTTPKPIGTQHVVRKIPIPNIPIVPVVLSI